MCIALVVSDTSYPEDTLTDKVAKIFYLWYNNIIESDQGSEVVVASSAHCCLCELSSRQTAR